MTSEPFNFLVSKPHRFFCSELRRWTVLVRIVAVDITTKFFEEADLISLCPLNQRNSVKRFYSAHPS